MSAGILHNWYLSKIRKATTPLEYYLAMQDFMLYELNLFNFNLR
jgi:hypothetical protein